MSNDINLDEFFNTEIWKPIKGFKGFYEISNHGRVKSLKRTIVRGNGRRQKIHEHIIKNSIDADGNNYVTLCRGGKCKIKKNHHLIFDAFGSLERDVKINHVNVDDVEVVYQPKLAEIKTPKIPDYDFLFNELKDAPQFVLDRLNQEEKSDIPGDAQIKKPEKEKSMKNKKQSIDAHIDKLSRGYQKIRNLICDLDMEIGHDKKFDNVVDDLYYYSRKMNNVIDDLYVCSNRTDKMED